MDRADEATVKSFLDCRFQSVNLNTLMRTWAFGMGRSTQPFRDCKAHNPGVLGVQSCLPLLQRPCRAARVTSLKTIRLTMRQAERLLREDNKVKVIHLVRDPRGTLNSRSKGLKFKEKRVKGHAGLLCSHILQDIQTGEELKVRYPGRVMTARYEDLAMEPLARARQLFSFAGLDLDAATKDYILNITSRGLKDTCALCTQRANSTVTASKWRRQLSFQKVSAIDSLCGGVYEKMGYLPLTSNTDLKKETVAAFIHPARVPGLW